MSTCRALLPYYLLLTTYYLCRAEGERLQGALTHAATHVDLPHRVQRQADLVGVKVRVGLGLGLGLGVGVGVGVGVRVRVKGSNEIQR